MVGRVAAHVGSRFAMDSRNRIGSA